MRVRKLIPYIVLLVIIAVALVIILVPRNKAEIMPETNETEGVVIDRDTESSDGNPEQVTDESDTATEEKPKEAAADTMPTQVNPVLITDTSKP